MVDIFVDRTLFESSYLDIVQVLANSAELTGYCSCSMPAHLLI